VVIDGNDQVWSSNFNGTSVTHLCGARNIDAPKSSPDEIVRTTLDALERGDGQVLADEITRKVHRGLSADAYFQSTDALRSPPGPAG
jgi:hypothetical protein